MTSNAPVRTCVACGKAVAKQQLVRVVKSPDGDVRLDASGKAAGRGAYVCQEAACFEKASKKRVFDGKLRTRLSADQYDSLRNDFYAICAKSAEAR